MMDLCLIFQFVKGRCHGNQIMIANEGKLIQCAFFARSSDGHMVLFRYYLLGGNTAAPSGLYARLCHSFLVGVVAHVFTARRLAKRGICRRRVLSLIHISEPTRPY